MQQIERQDRDLATTDIAILQDPVKDPALQEGFRPHRERL
jgi:hypothetical protein